MDKLKFSRRDFMRGSSSAAGLALIGSPFKSMVRADVPGKAGPTDATSAVSSPNNFVIPPCAWK